MTNKNSHRCHKSAEVGFLSLLSDQLLIGSGFCSGKNGQIWCTTCHHIRIGEDISVYDTTFVHIQTFVS